MYLKTFDINVLKYINWNTYPAHSLFAPGLTWQACLKKIKVETELLTDIDMLLIVKKFKGGICHAIHKYPETNKKHVKNYEKDGESSLYLHLQSSIYM